MTKLVKFLKDDSGVTSIEYAMIASTMALTLVAVLPSVESALNAQYSAVAGAM